MRDSAYLHDLRGDDMKKYRNLGHHEQVIRVGVGLLLLAFSAFSLFPAWGNLTLMIVGLIIFLTGIVGYCPAWHMAGVNTHQTKNPESPDSYPQSPVDERAETTSDRP
jgi:hypothetical protein